VILSDGKTIYFSLAAPGKDPKLFGGIPVEQAVARSSGWNGAVHAVRRTDGAGGQHFGGPEGSEFARLELSVSAVARALSMD
jgi:hypothetical protein